MFANGGMKFSNPRSWAAMVVTLVWAEKRLGTSTNLALITLSETIKKLLRPPKLLNETWIQNI